MTNTGIDPINVHIREIETNAYVQLEPPLAPGVSQTYTVSAGRYEIWGGSGFDLIFRGMHTPQGGETIRLP